MSKKPFEVSLSYDENLLKIKSVGPIQAGFSFSVKDRETKSRNFLSHVHVCCPLLNVRIVSIDHIVDLLANLSPIHRSRSFTIEGLPAGSDAKCDIISGGPGTELTGLYLLKCSGNTKIRPNNGSRTQASSIQAT